MKHTNKRAAPGKARPEGTTNAGQSTACRCEQQHLFPMPPQERAEGSVADYLLARPGWHDRMNVSVALSITDREARAQAEYSGGAVIFGSRRGQGLKHIAHADAWEIRACAAELRYRALSHLRRAEEVERAGGLAR